MQRLTADVLGLVSNGRPPGDRFDDIVLWCNTVVRQADRAAGAVAVRLTRWRTEPQA